MSIKQSFYEENDVLELMSEGSLIAFSVKVAIFWTYLPNLIFIYFVTSYALIVTLVYNCMHLQLNCLDYL